MFGRPVAGAPPMSHREEMRVFVAFLVQPLVAALCGFLAFLVILDDGQSCAPSNTALSGSMWAARAFGFAAGLVGFFVTPLAALALFVWLRRRGPITLTKTLVSGAALGNVVPLAAVLGSSVTFSAVVVGTAVGVTCAATFWWIAGRHLLAR
jgi:hypothetical protein